jgi:hypothetical protein
LFGNALWLEYRVLDERWKYGDESQGGHGGYGQKY